MDALGGQASAPISRLSLGAMVLASATTVPGLGAFDDAVAARG